MQQKKKPPPPKSAPKKAPTNPPKAKSKQGPPQKKAKPQQATGTRVAKVPKTAAQKNFVLQPDTSTPDPLVMKTVCFDVQDQKYGTQLAHHLFPDDPSKLKPSLKNINGVFYLFGTITGGSKKKAGKTQNYDIQWEDSSLGTTAVDLAIVISALELCKRVNHSHETGPFSPDSVFNTDILSYLANHVDEGEAGNLLDSDDDDGLEETQIGNSVIFGDRLKVEESQFVLSENEQAANKGRPKRDDGLRFM